MRGPDTRVLTRDGRDGLLLCRLGDIAAADRKLPPRSVAFYRSVAFDDPGIAQNIEARRPPADTLLGIRELARVVVRDSVQAWFASNPYGWGHLRTAFAGHRLCRDIGTGVEPRGSGLYAGAGAGSAGACR